MRHGPGQASFLVGPATGGPASPHEQKTLIQRENVVPAGASFLLCCFPASSLLRSPWGCGFSPTRAALAAQAPSFPEPASAAPGVGLHRAQVSPAPAWGSASGCPDRLQWRGRSRWHLPNLTAGNTHGLASHAWGGG